jgi:hypothetical protein
MIVIAGLTRNAVAQDAVIHNPCEFGQVAVVGVDPFVQGQPTRLGFDYLPSGMPLLTPIATDWGLFVSGSIANAFRSVGVGIGANCVALSDPANPSGTGTISLPNVVCGMTHVPFNGPMDISFVDSMSGSPSTVSSAAIWCADGPTNDTQVSFYDASDNLITTLSAPTVPALWFAGLHHPAGIARMHIENTGSDDYYVDDLYYGNVVPACAPGTPFCFPISSGVIACPCSNPGSVGSGCNNSSNTGGATLGSNGLPSLTIDSVHLIAAGEKPTATSVFLQGTTQIPSGLPFGQGVRCVGGTLSRLYVHNALAGTVSAPVGTDSSISVRSAALGHVIAPDETLYYMVYYRDPIVLGGCPMTATFNATEALAITWSP